MADNRNITSTDAIIILTVADLYPNGVRIEQFSTDTMFTTEDLTLSESRMGVDGKLCMGFTPAPIGLTISLEASSPSRPIFERIARAEYINKKVYLCDIQITIPSIGKEYSLNNGCLNGGHLIPDAKKVLDPTNWSFTFESVRVSSI